MDDPNQELAGKIEAVSPLSYETALRALQAGGRPRELALSILEAEDKYAEDNANIAASKKKLTELISA
jgi:hypothetical protein